jgi:mycothiol synthase
MHQPATNPVPPVTNTVAMIHIKSDGSASSDTDRLATVVPVVEVVEIDVDRLTDADRHGLIAFEQTMWAEYAPDDVAMAEEPALWLATQQRANAERATWVVHAPSGSEMAGVAALSLPSVDNRHLGYVELRVAPAHRRQHIGASLLLAVARRAQAEHRRLLEAFSSDIVSAGEAFARSIGAADQQVVRRSDLDLRAVDRELVGRWLDVPSDVHERYELWPVVGPYPTDQYSAIAEIEAVMNTMPHDDLDMEDAVIDADWVAQREQQQEHSPGERWTIFVRERATQRLAGFTQVFFYDDWPGHVDQGNTGVHPDYRGHGLGRWLKAAMIDRIFHEKPESFRIRTNNAFSNAHMLTINNDLGFAVTAKQTVWEADVDQVLRSLS